MRFHSAMSLPPTPQQHFFSIREDCAGIKMSFPRWRCRRSQFFRSRPRCRSHFFVAPALVAVHSFGFFNPSNGILLVFRGITLCVTFGERDFRMRQIRRVYFAWGVQKTNAYSCFQKSMKFFTKSFTITLEID